MDKLLSQMTLEEKISLIRGDAEAPSTYQGQAGYLSGIPRLGIPSLRFADGPPGVLTRHPAQAETATMAVAATFSVRDATDNGVVIGREARALGIDVALQPFINIDRDITFSRGFNTFGEDPMLTGSMGAAEVRGIQSQDVMSTAKHYIAYDSNSDNIFVDPQALHEIYLRPFADAVQADVSSIMCSYNQVNGAYACGNSDTLKSILREGLRFKGFVISDWGAVHSADFLSHGLDMEMPGRLAPGSPLAAFTPSYFDTKPPGLEASGKPDPSVTAALLGNSLPEEPPQRSTNLAGVVSNSDPKTLREALRDGRVTEAMVTKAAGRVLYEMERFGYLDGKQKHSVTAEAIEANARIIEKTAEDGAVLLKNHDNALPLKASDLRSLALIGPGAGQIDAIGLFGERSGGLVQRQISPLQALRTTAANQHGAHISYAVDDDMTGEPIPASRLSHDGGSGLVRIGKDGRAQTDSQVNFTRVNGRALPANSSWTWRGTITLPSSGTYWLYLQTLGARGVLAIDHKDIGWTGALFGALHGDVQYPAQDNIFPTTDGLDNVRCAVQLSAGSHAIEVRVSGDTSDAPEEIRLNWVTPWERQRNHASAIAAARSARTAVVFLWTRGKPDFALPGEQNKLVEEIASVNSNTIVVLNVSQPIAMPWLSKVKAVLQMWWPGDEGGWATANLLLGRTSPGGRLPFTWAYHLTDYPATDPAHPERSKEGVDGKTTYTEGIFVGYRWFDKQRIAPLFPFGYGLSYTSFYYSDIQAKPAADGGFNIRFQIKNTGHFAADEVPQAYLGSPSNQLPGAQFAVRALCAFDRIRLQPGEVKTAVLHIPNRSLEYWSTRNREWMTAVGRRSIYVGGSSRNLPLHVSVVVSER